MGKYKITPKAREDLKEIYRHITADSPRAAVRLRDLFHKKFHMLAANPLSGERRDDLTVNIRMFTAGNYVILYRPMNHGIEIVKVVHSARDLPTLWSATLRKPR